MTNENMKKNGQACNGCGKYLGMAAGRVRYCKPCHKVKKEIGVENGKN